MKCWIQDWVSFQPKARKIRPFIYWVTTPIHSFFSKERNNLRIKFNLSLESVVRAQENMRVVKMKNWDTKDSKLVTNDRMTDFGLTSYWIAVDAAVQYNVEKRESYILKKPALTPMTAGASNEEQAHCSRDQPCGRTFRPDDRRFCDEHGWRDPMPSFFRRRGHNVDHRMDGREDRLDRCRSNDRYILP